MNKLNSKIHDFFVSKSVWHYLFILAVSLIIIYGILLRTHALFHSHNIFYDEAALLLNIKERTYLQLFLPLTHSQCCPPLFLVIGKFINANFGLNLIALRSITFIFSTLSLFLFAGLSFKIFKSKFAIIFSNFMFAFSPWILTYQMFFKQYVSDVFISTLILLLVFIYKNKQISTTQVVLFAFLSVLCILMSYTSVILISSTFIIFAICKYNKLKSFEWFKKISIFSSILGIFLILYYFINMKLAINNDALKFFWKMHTPLFYPNQLDMIKDIVNLLSGDLFKSNASMLLVFISLLLLLVRDRFLFSILFLPFVIAFILGYLQIYPMCSERVILYLIPLFIILVNKIFDADIYFEKKFKRIFCFFLVFILFLYSLNVLELKRISKNIFTRQYTNITDYIYENRYKREKTSNVETALKILEQYNISKSDYLIIKFADFAVYDIYDKKDIVNKEHIKITDVNVSDIPINSRIYMYISEEYDDTTLFYKFLQKCKIEQKIEDGKYNLIIAKRVK